MFQDLVEVVEPRILCFMPTNWQQRHKLGIANFCPNILEPLEIGFLKAT
jgi:hypothetical protein